MSIKPGIYSIKCVGHITQVLEYSPNGYVAVGWRETETRKQRWDIQYSSSGAYTIRNMETGQYLGWEGDKVIASNTKFDWDITMSYQGRFKIEASGDGRAVQLSSSRNGDQVQLVNFTGSNSQSWYFQHRDLLDLKI
ncbi:hypothetical protein BGX26_008827 [Mortierella sp. AD094]|nr:hypothetical protein BGX26_008827 [Mortierella sp. AD094]